MNDLDNALYCESINRMNKTERRNEEKDAAYMTLKNMHNMLMESWRSKRELPIPLRGEEPSRFIQDRYGIPYQSEFNAIWVILERVCNGEYTLNKKEDVQSIK